MTSGLCFAWQDTSGGGADDGTRFDLTATVMLAGLDMPGNEADKQTLEVTIRVSLAATLDDVSPNRIVITSLQETDVELPTNRRLLQAIAGLAVDFEVKGFASFAASQAAQSQLTEATTAQADGNEPPLLQTILLANGVADLQGLVLSDVGLGIAEPESPAPTTAAPVESPPPDGGGSNTMVLGIAGMSATERSHAVKAHVFSLAIWPLRANRGGAHHADMRSDHTPLCVCVDVGAMGAVAVAALVGVGAMCYHRRKSMPCAPPFLLPATPSTCSSQPSSACDSD